MSQFGRDFGFNVGGTPSDYIKKLTCADVIRSVTPKPRARIQKPFIIVTDDP
jgi:hypothetical protein